jgi:hypothetical protein
MLAVYASILRYTARDGSCWQSSKNSGGICKHFVVKIAKEWLRKNVFTPWAILREMDLAGGTLSFEGIEVLRRVEMKGEKSVHGCVVIPCPADIKRCSNGRAVCRAAMPLHP